jgi:hypothetical protein
MAKAQSTWRFLRRHFLRQRANCLEIDTRAMIWKVSPVQHDVKTNISWKPCETETPNSESSELPLAFKKLQ